MLASIAEIPREGQQLEPPAAAASGRQSDAGALGSTSSDKQPSHQQQQQQQQQGSQNPYPPSERWADLKDTITRLYKEENRTLKETMEIMEREHQFYATARMYKTRIKNWGLDKKFKADEVLVMLQAKKGRDVANKETEFVVRGSKVDPRRMRRYLQRNKTVLQLFDASLSGADPRGAGSGSGSSSYQHQPHHHHQHHHRQQQHHHPHRNPRLARAVEVRTPSPEPSLGSPSSSSSSSSSMALVPLAASPSVGLPGPAKETERLLHSMRSYLGGSFASGTWFFDPYGRLQSRKGGQGEMLLNDVWTRLEVVASGMATAEDVKVYGTLNPAFESLQEIVREESPLLLSRMLRLSRKLELLRNRQLWQVLMDYIDGQTRSLLGPHHILHLIWAQFRAMDVGTDEEVLDRAFMLLVAEFDASCASAVNFGVLEAYRDHFDTVSSPSRRRNLEAQESKLKRALALLPPNSHGSLPALGLRLRMRVTSSLVACERGDFALASSILRSSPPSFLEFSPLGPWAVASQHGALGHVLMAEGDFPGAEAAFMDAVAQVDGAEGYGNESCLERMLANLERLYTAAGRHADATAMRHRRLLRLLDGARLRHAAASSSVPATDVSAAPATPSGGGAPDAAVTAAPSDRLVASGAGPAAPAARAAAVAHGQHLLQQAALVVVGSARHQTPAPSSTALTQGHVSGGLQLVKVEEDGT